MEPPDRSQEFTQNKHSLDRRDHLDRAFTPEYAAAKQEVRQARQQVKTLNKRISDLRAGAPTGPQYNKPDAGTIPRQTEDQIRHLKHQRGQVRATAFERVQAQTKDASPESQVRMQKAAQRELQKGMSQSAREKQMGIRLTPGSKSVNRAQERFLRLREAAQPARVVLPVRATPEAVAVSSVATRVMQHNMPNLSMRFSATLGYTRHVEQAQALPAPSAPTKELPAAQQPALPAAEQFSSTLHVEQAKQEAAQPELNSAPASREALEPTKED